MKRSFFQVTPLKITSAGLNLSYLVYLYFQLAVLVLGKSHTKVPDTVYLYVCCFFLSLNLSDKIPVSWGNSQHLIIIVSNRIYWKNRSKAEQIMLLCISHCLCAFRHTRNTRELPIKSFSQYFTFHSSHGAVDFLNMGA